ncbi:Similar to S.cerevisiae protein VPS24 (One of four subunits of the ESCRT-III complex) [Malassezia sympodialis ATCC 42132]|uniref:Similar to S.cerevisiae protein VPS24 (One of four subunits of the ESCRT-III complex) n=1 Tax=Malassezia sympodialis (strain ATCC 42132) TaxID=1230383 RepID=A0A1M8A5Z8_MALS4|nr:Similar to S.cerevisiae protein VPS24 (One of four subunits of the ESCRT-III complex) [Malassezia sympodialis ATCC 42132]
MQSLTRLIYGPSKEERVRHVQQRLRQEQRALDREVRQIDQAVAKVKVDIKRLARKGDTANARILASEVVRSNKHKLRLITSKAQLNSIALQLQQQLSMYKVTGHLQKSTEIMKLSQNLIQIPQMTSAMRDMGAELMKAGILEEMMHDALDASALGEDAAEIDEAAQDEVNRVLYELTDGKLGEAEAAPAHAPLEGNASQESEAGTESLEQMQKALQGLLQG